MLFVGVFSHQVMSDYSANLWTLARQAPLIMARILEWVAISFSRGSSQPRSLSLQAKSLPTEVQGKPTPTEA